jgi:molybdenum cofactor cytidylyltransferase
MDNQAMDGRTESRMSAERYAAIVLAGGFSQRMHSFKPLLSIGGETITDRLIFTFQNNGVEVFLVTGYRQEDLLAGIKSKTCRVVENSDYASGMFSSVQAGLRALEGDFNGVFIAPVDIPLVRPFTVQRLISSAAKNPGKIVYPVFGTRRGHPPLLPGDEIRSIVTWPKDETLKAALRRLDDQAVDVAVPDRYIHQDLDNPSDYERVKESFNRYGVPNDEECGIIEKDVFDLNPGILGHCAKVAQLADALGAALAEVKMQVDLGAVHAAARLHDLAKGQAEHEAAGAKLLNEMGFDQIAALVAAHKDLGEGQPSGSSPTLEAKIVYLADKLAIGAARVSLEERFEAALKRFGDDANSGAGVQKRLAQAVGVKKEIEALLGRPLEKALPD